MTDTLDRATGISVVPVRHGGREIGAYVVRPGGAEFVPAVDVSRIAVAALGAATAMTVALSVAIGLRRRPVVGSIAMGPGGWVSLKRTSSPRLRDTARRPWWAHVLQAHRLVPEGNGPARRSTSVLCRTGRAGRA